MDNRLLCFNKLEELFSLYDKVRQSVILLENFNEEQKMYIAPINQLRSALDHIFKAVSCGQCAVTMSDEVMKFYLYTKGYTQILLSSSSWLIAQSSVPVQKFNG